MKSFFSKSTKEIKTIFEKHWLAWVFFVFIITAVGLPLINHWGFDWIKDFKEVTPISKEILHQAATKSQETEISAVAEYQSYLSILSLAISVVVAWVAYKQLPSIANQAKAEFLARIDERWCSKEITEVREELWIVYRKAKNKPLTKQDYIKEVQEYILVIDRKAKDDPTPANMQQLFRYLNFLEFLGTVSILYEKELIEEDLLQSIFGERLKTYLEFFEGYFERHQSSTIHAKKLLDHMRKLEDKKESTYKESKEASTNP